MVKSKRLLKKRRNKKIVKVKKYGWVLQAKNGKFITKDGDEFVDIKEAEVYPTRKRAFMWDGGIFSAVANMDGDVVRKVELLKNGKAKKIISGR